MLHEFTCICGKLVSAGEVSGFYKYHNDKQCDKCECDIMSSDKSYEKINQSKKWSYSMVWGALFMLDEEQKHN